jgi:RimJ/RimL family protein N-acetyltransferase
MSAFVELFSDRICLRQWRDEDREAPPCVEVGWRLAFEHWGQGYATEAARLALGYGFGTLALPEIVSFTSATNHCSRAVMERLGMRRDPADDFDCPTLPEGHPLRPHVLYRLGSGSYFGMR